MKTTDKLYIIDVEHAFNQTIRGWSGSCGAYSFKITFIKNETNDVNEFYSNKKLAAESDVKCTVFYNGKEIGRSIIENEKANEGNIVIAIKNIINSFIQETKQAEEWSEFY